MIFYLFISIITCKRKKIILKAYLRRQKRIKRQKIQKKKKIKIQRQILIMKNQKFYPFEDIDDLDEFYEYIIEEEYPDEEEIGIIENQEEHDVEIDKEQNKNNNNEMNK